MLQGVGNGPLWPYTKNTTKGFIMLIEIVSVGFWATALIAHWLVKK